MSVTKSISEFFRSLKASYVVGNVLNLPKLEHNRSAYQQYGLRRPIIAPISSKHMPTIDQPLPWLDQPDGQTQLTSRPGYKDFAPEVQAALKSWDQEGYLILKGFFSTEKIEAINAEIERLMKEKKVDYREWARKIMFAFKHSDLLKETVTDPRLISIMEFILGKEITLFQSINFLEGSEQRAHSDSIHMTTYPLGYMIASWIALEEVSPENGTLFYYPGSHRLPYLLNPDFDHGGGRFTIGKQANKRYEDAIEAVIKKNQLEKKEFNAQPGDLLIWHANLIHGGSPILKPGSSRKSMVAHYFAKEVICYHELTQRPALISS